MDFLELFWKIIDAEFSIPEILGGIATLFSYVFADSTIIMVNEFIRELIAVALPYLPFVYIGLAAILALFGKKLFSLPRFLAFFWLGFVLGTYFLSPLVASVIPTLPLWIVGVVVGIIAAVLSKFLYFILYTVAIGYPVFVLCYSTILKDAMTVEMGKHWVSLGIALLVVVIMFVIRKYVEMLGTAALGGFIIAESIRMLYDYTTLEFLAGIEWVGVLVITALVALIGFIVQFKTREKY